jgi:hypothetical protein
LYISFNSSRTLIFCRQIKSHILVLAGEKVLSGAGASLRSQVWHIKTHQQGILVLQTWPRPTLFFVATPVVVL